MRDSRNRYFERGYNMWPFFEDLGKDAKDIFSSGYNTGLFKLGVRSKTSREVEFSSNIATNLDTYNASGALQTKYRTKCGTFLLKLDTDNKFITQVTFTDMFGEGTQLSWKCAYAPQEGYKSAHVRGSYTNDICSLRADLYTNGGRPKLFASAVAGCCCWLGGVQTVFDLNKKIMTGNSIAIGYLAKDFTFHSAFNNGNELIGSIYQKVNSNLDFGIQIAASSEINKSQLDLGCRYKMDPEATVFAKGDSRGQVSFGYQQKLHERVIFCLSTLYNVNYSSVGHCKLGIALYFNL